MEAWRWAFWCHARVTLGIEESREPRQLFSARGDLQHRRQNGVALGSQQRKEREDGGHRGTAEHLTSTARVE